MYAKLSSTSASNSASFIRALRRRTTKLTCRGGRGAMNSESAPAAAVRCSAWFGPLPGPLADLPGIPAEVHAVAEAAALEGNLLATAAQLVGELRQRRAAHQL